MKTDSILNIQFVIIFILIFLISISSCNIDNELNQAALDVDATTNKLTGSADQMRDEIGKMSKKIPDDVKKLINNDLNGVIKTSIAATSNQFKCDINFVRSRLSKSLKNLAAEIRSHISFNKGKPINKIAFSPQICNCEPFVIEPDKQINHVLFSGYDFPSTGLKIFAKKDNGDFVDLSKHLAQPTEFNVAFVVNMDLLQSYERLSLQYPGLEGNREVLILPKTPSLCAQTPQPITPNPAGISFIAQNHTRGDADFGGHGPDITFTGDLGLSSDKRSVICTIHFIAFETHSDNSTVSQDQAFSIYTCDPGYEISDILTSKHFNYHYIDNNHNDDAVGANGFVSSGLIRGDTGGDDIGRYTGATVNFNNMRVLLRECCDGCLDKLALDSFIAKSNLKYTEFVILDSISKSKRNNLKTNK